MLRYAITDRNSFPGHNGERTAALIRNSELWAARGIDFIQLREKDLGTGSLARLSRRMLTAIRAHRSPPKLLINSRADVAIAIGADGVHLTSSPGSVTIIQVRELYAAAGLPKAIVSVSCHTLEEVSTAREAGADVILFGPVFEKRIGQDIVTQGSGLGMLRKAVAAGGPVPVLALGGVTADNVAECIEAGASGVAAIRLFRAENLIAAGPGSVPGEILRNSLS